MERKLSSKKYIPFTYKMMIPYLILVLLTDVLVGYIAYTMLVESRTEMAETNVRTALKQTRNNIEYQTDEIKRMTNSLFLNTNFQNALQFRGDPLENMLKMRDDIVPYMKAPLQLYGNKLRLALFTVNETMLEITGDDMSTPIGRSDYYVLSDQVIENTEWFKSIIANNKDSLWLQADKDRELGNISYFRKLVSSKAAPAIIGYIRVTARIDELFGNFDTFPTEQGINLRLMDRATGLTLYEQGVVDEQRKQDAYLIISEDIPVSSYVIEARVPHSYLNKDASRMRKVISTVCSISFLVMAIIGFLVARISGKKIKRIVYLVRSFQEGNFYKRIGFPGNDEFVYIANSFNQMATSIQELIRNVYVQGIQKKQAELDVLQAQISPHFLYNTLSTIGSLANMGEVEKVTQMVQGLSKFYRLTLNDGHVYISLENELEQVRMYLEIQRVKYADAFEVYYDVDPEILQVPIIKLILQPFVENIFKHAWFGETIAIRITGKRLGDRIELKVIDNGIGMRPETLRNMRSSAYQPGSYGLRNVEERIKLRYGSDFGIQIGSYFGAGTTVQIILPVENAEIREVMGGVRSMAMEINVLLVDDEVIDLEWLRRRVAGSDHLPLHSVRTATSGFAALKMMEQHPVDIILSDIGMPIMSGVEFARKAKEINPEVHILFISGHQDFNYAKEAIQLNAYSYLLKPVDDDELNETLTELCTKIEKERTQRTSLSETLTLVNQELLLRWFNEAAPGQVETHIHNVLTPYLQGASAVAIIEIDDMARKIQTWTEEERSLWSSTANQFIRKFAQDQNLGMVITTYDYHFVILAAVQEQYFTALLEELIRVFYQEFSCSITIGRGMYTTDPIKLHDSYRQAQAALSIKWIVGKNRLIQDASEWSPKEKMASDLEVIVDRMLKAMLDYDLTTIDDCLLQLFAGDSPISQKNDIYDIIIRITSKLHADLQQMNEHLYEILNWDSHHPFVLFQFETVHDILSWLRRRFFELSELLYLKRQRQKRKLIDEITEYVKERLDQKITLNEVAAHFDFTPNYLGHLFKVETNSLFSDFLSELRMKRVCELLEDPTKKVYEIAEQAGYKNIIYFNRQFKQYMGMSPGEYRKKNKI